MACQGGGHRTKLSSSSYPGVHKERWSEASMPDIWNQSDWGFVGNRWWHLCLQAPREVGAISAPRKHASVSWMKLFWPKPGHPTRLERETLPPLFTLDCSPLSCWVPSSYTFKIPFFHQNPTHPPRPSSHAAFALTSLASPLRAMLSFLCAL